MKIKIVPLIISIGISLLIGYGVFAANNNEWQKWLMFGISAVEFSILLGGGFGFKYSEKGNVNITVLSVIFAIVALIVQIVASFLFKLAPYIIINGIIALLYIGIAYALAKALQ